MDYKCRQCHSVSARGIEATPKEGDEVSDLSDVGKRYDADWIRRYLLRQEAKEGKKHERKFRGESSELEALVKWLATLRG